MHARSVHFGLYGWTRATRSEIDRLVCCLLDRDMSDSSDSRERWLQHAPLEPLLDVAGRIDAKPVLRRKCSRKGTGHETTQARR